MFYCLLKRTTTENNGERNTHSTKAIYCKPLFDLYNILSTIVCRAFCLLQDYVRTSCKALKEVEGGPIEFNKGFVLYGATLFQCYKP